MMERLKDEVAVVTGGAQGIGAAYALALAKAGAKGAIGDVADTGAVQASLEAVGGTTFCSRLDVTDPESVNEFVRLTEEKLGNISILVNNAALFSSLETMPFTEISSGEWDKVMAVNVRGSFEVAKAVVPSMRSNGRGSIINIASISSFVDLVEVAAYAAAKAGIFGISMTAAKEWARYGIRSNTVSFGVVETPMTEVVRSEKFREDILSRIALGYWAEPLEVVRPVAFLLSDSASYITGQNLGIDGGMNINI